MEMEAKDEEMGPGDGHEAPTQPEDDDDSGGRRRTSSGDDGDGGRRISFDDACGRRRTFRGNGRPRSVFGSHSRINLAMRNYSFRDEQACAPAASQDDDSGGGSGSNQGQGRRSSHYSEQTEVDYWMPPPNLEDERSDAPLAVDFRCACFKLTNVSTVDFTALIKFVVVFEWNDLRLKGMPITTNDLPGDLWGPDIILENAQNDCEVVYDSFALLDAETGRLKRTVTFHGYVYNPMDLKDFPFDEDDLELKFITICHWKTLDEARHGNDPVNQVYILRPMRGREDVEFFTLAWGGKVNEFRMLGYKESTNNTAHDPTKPIIFKFDIHLARKAQYYILKILAPLWLIILTSLASYGIEADDFQGRLEVIFTLLLSSIALLYVVQESIPKISSLTLVDKVVLATLLSLSLSVLFSYFISRSPNPTQLNFVLGLTNQVAYWLANIALLGPPYYRYRQQITKVERKRHTTNKEGTATSTGKITKGKSYRFEVSDGLLTSIRK